MGRTEDLSLAYIGRQLESEHQIRAWKKAAEDNSLPQEDQQCIEEYITLVRRYGAASTLPAVTEAYEKVSQLASSSMAPKMGAAGIVDFPKTGVGIQCDINFSNHLALHNTVLLRCYNHCDPRVRPLVLAIKAWAKRREINSPYHGTLSSYGYVLMVLHFLVNVAHPPIVPNLQLDWRPSQYESGSSGLASETMVEGYDVRFWRSEAEIKELAQRGLLTQNRQPLGQLLRQFFEYYASQGPQVTGNGFIWVVDVISLRTRGGLLSKQEKGWTGAKTTVAEPAQPGQQKKEIRHRYLFAIEDPFETDHNIARTVTHNGIVAIRGEFRRAWKIISNFGKNQSESIDEVFRPLYESQENDGKNGIIGSPTTLDSQIPQ